MVHSVSNPNECDCCVSVPRHRTTGTGRALSASHDLSSIKCSCCISNRSSCCLRSLSCCASVQLQSAPSSRRLMEALSVAADARGGAAACPTSELDLKAEHSFLICFARTISSLVLQLLTDDTRLVSIDVRTVISPSSSISQRR